jgi:spore germination protein KA
MYEFLNMVHTIPKSQFRMVFMKQHFWASLLNKISYQEKHEATPFFIPESDDTEVEEEPLKDTPSTSTKKDRQLKKPIPVEELKKEPPKNKDPLSLSKDLDQNLAIIKKEFHFPQNKDIIIREISILESTKCAIIFIDGMVDRTIINQFILRPLFQLKNASNSIKTDLFTHLTNHVIEIHQLKPLRTLEEATTDILAGNTAILLDGFDACISCETKGFEKRSVGKPVIESVVKGSQEAFTENMRTNITLIRKIIKNKDLTTEFFTLGERTHVYCAILYMKGIVNPALVKEVTRRLSKIKTDYIFGADILEQFIEDEKNSLMGTILSTERPDRVTSFLVEGKVAIVCEGTPFVLVVPTTFISFLHTSEESTIRWEFGTFIRLVRMFALFTAIMFPGLYVALTNFHREMIPTDLLIAIGQARENVPFPTLVEVILMEASFELIREAGVRIPGIIGNTIGIIGALILGQAAVQANLVSPMLIIIVAFTGLGNFALPNFNLAFTVRILRIIFILSGAFLGFIGIYISFICSIAFLIHTKSFGVSLLTISSKDGHPNTDFIIKKTFVEARISTKLFKHLR